MLLSSVILVLQETLEAALLISVLMAISRQIRLTIIWFPWGLFVGGALSYLYATKMQLVSEWFDYAGQEVVNAFLHAMIALAIIILFWAIFKIRPAAQTANGTNKKFHVFLFQLCAVVAVTMTMAREGSELLVYLGGFIQQGDKLQTVLTGSGIGFCIGVSAGSLLYYALVGLPSSWGFTGSVLLMALSAGNMLSQAALLLTQADWIPSGRSLWDTSPWLSENSISGQLLYALIGYEATPSWIQIVSYLTGTAMVLAVAFKAKYWASRDLFVK